MPVNIEISKLKEHAAKQAPIYRLYKFTLNGLVISEPTYENALGKVKILQINGYFPTFELDKYYYFIIR